MYLRVYNSKLVLFILSLTQSSSMPLILLGDAGVYPSAHWAEGRKHPGCVASPSEGRNTDHTHQRKYQRNQTKKKVKKHGKQSEQEENSQ